MQDTPPFAALGAARYEAADPATAAELRRNGGIRALNLTLAKQAGAQAEPAGTVLPLRARRS